MDRYAVPVVFNSWGLIGDYTRDLLTNPTRFAATCGELVGGIVDNRNPQFALKVIDTIAPDEKIPTFGAQWFSRLGFRLARLSTYAQAYYIKTDPIVRDRLRSLLAWARADLAIPLTELKIAVGLADLAEGPPRLVIGSRDNDEPTEDADTIRQFVTWVGDELLGGLSHLHAVVLEAAFQNGQALDNALPEIAPRIDLSHITARAIDNARGGLAIAARDAPSRPGGHAGLVALLSDAFKLPCGPDTEPTELAMMIDKIPVNLLLDEYTHAIPAALDIAAPVRHFGRHDAGKVLSNGAIAVLRHRIREHRAAGRHVGLYVDPSGEYGICLLEEEVAAIFCDPGEESVIVRCSLPGGSVTHILQRWTELTDGLLLG
jgi:hypothetical protein